MLDIPELVRQRALSNGAAGQDWLERLPGRLDELAERWNLELGRPYSGGTAGYVARASTSGGVECVVKIAMPLDMNEADAFDRSIRTHQLADGAGCVRLLAFDTDSDGAPAMLLERLGPNLDELGLDVPQILTAVAGALSAFWRPLDENESEGLMTGFDAAHWLADYIVRTWEEVGQPCGRDVIDRALEYCASRADAFDPAIAVLVHGDAHGWNTVQAADGGFKLVDPEGLFSEPAHDLAVPMREYNGPLLAGDTQQLTRERAEYLGATCDVDPEAVWEWGFIERVSTGLANVRDFDNDDGADFLEVARRCL